MRADIIQKLFADHIYCEKIGVTLHSKIRAAKCLENLGFVVSTILTSLNVLNDMEANGFCISLSEFEKIDKECLVKSLQFNYRESFKMNQVALDIYFKYSLENSVLFTLLLSQFTIHPDCWFYWGFRLAQLEFFPESLDLWRKCLDYFRKLAKKDESFVRKLSDLLIHSPNQ